MDNNDNSNFDLRSNKAEFFMEQIKLKNSLSYLEEVINAIYSSIDDAADADEDTKTGIVVKNPQSSSSSPPQEYTFEKELILMEAIIDKYRIASLQYFDHPILFRAAAVFFARNEQLSKRVFNKLLFEIEILGDVFLYLDGLRMMLGNEVVVVVAEDVLDNTGDSEQMKILVELMRLRNAATLDVVANIVGDNDEDVKVVDNDDDDDDALRSRRLENYKYKLKQDLTNVTKRICSGGLVEEYLGQIAEKIDVMINKMGKEKEEEEDVEYDPILLC